MYPAYASSPPRRDRRPLGLAAAAVLAVVVLLLALSRCSHDEEARAACVIGVDRSPSAADEPKMPPRYERWIRDAVEGCAAKGARIQIIPITSNTEADAMGAVSAELDIRGLTGDPAADAPLLEDRTRSVMDRVDRMLAARPASTQGGTDLITFPRVAARAFQADDRFRAVIIISDALNTRDPVPLNEMTLTTERTDELVDDLGSRGLVPNLDGVQVSFVGVGIGSESAKLPLDAPAKIEAFWRSYYAATGADLVRYVGDPGPAGIDLDA